MKKLIVFSVIFALVAGVAFADVAGGITINAWGRGFVVPLAIATAAQADGKTVDGAESTVYAGTGIGWYHPNAPRVDFRISGDKEGAGFRVQLSGDGGSVNVEDDAYLYVKPFQDNTLRLLAGRYIDATLGGPGTPIGAFNNLTLPGAGLQVGGLGIGAVGDDGIFTRFRSGGGDSSTWNKDRFGFLVTSAPMDGLFIGAAVNGQYTATEAKDAYRFMHLALGYTIQDIGKLRVGYIGGFTGEQGTGADDPAFEGRAAKLEAAFALTAVEGLSLDLGFRTQLAITEGDVKSTPGSQINFVAGFRATDMITIGASGTVGFGGYRQVGSNDDSANALTMRFDIVPTFALDFGTVTLGASFASKGESKNAAGEGNDDAATQLGFGGWFGKGVGGGNFKAGVTFALPVSNKDGAQGSGFFAIPIVFEYAFF